MSTAETFLLFFNDYSYYYNYYLYNYYDSDNYDYNDRNYADYDDYSYYYNSYDHPLLRRPQLQRQRPPSNYHRYYFHYDP